MIQVSINPQGVIVGNFNEIAYDVIGLKYYRQTTSPFGTRWIEISSTAATGLTNGIFGDTTHIPVITVSRGVVTNITEVLVTAGGSQTLAQTLAIGNLTGGNNIIVSDGDLITGSGGQIRMDFGNDASWSVSTDGAVFATPLIAVTPTAAGVSWAGTAAIGFDATASTIFHSLLISLTAPQVDVSSLSGFGDGFVLTNNAGTLSYGLVSVDGVTITGDGTAGNPLTASGTATSWLLTGNMGTDGGTNNFIGTSDAQNLQFRANNVQSGFIDFSNIYTFFGYSTGLGASGANLVGVGYGALQNNTGAEIIGIGDSAGNSNTGNTNIFIGLNAGIGNTLNDVILLGKNVTAVSTKEFALSSDIDHLNFPLNGMVAGYVLTVDGTATYADWQPAVTGYVLSVSNTATVNLTVDGFGDLTADFASMNISQFTNDSGYLTSAALTGYVPYSGATSDVTLGLFDLRASSLKINDTGTDYMEMVVAENFTAPRTLSFVLNDTNRVINLSGDLTVSATASVSGTNTGNQNFTASGDATAPSSASNLALTLATVNANVGTFGSATQVGQFTVNAKGLITAASNITITPAASSITGGAALTKTDDTNVTLTLGGTPTSALLQATSITVGWTGTLADSRLSTTTVVAGSYGSSSSVATFTVGATGRLTTATTTAIQISESQVTNLTTDLTNIENDALVFALAL